ncbi:MAG TPA: MaoC family dehydratase N-terminal domain-containing protein [Casimicrobiaceae bacterium]|nr:MaoC family dehydratase N-terminal domain-containing protein [Casimicrobiaceae bacterium]
MSNTQGSLEAWIGKQETLTDVITSTPYAALSAIFDRNPVRPPAGTPLPPLWHWLYFLPLVRQSEIGPDGHAKRGGFLPPVPLPRRMWAGSQFEFRRPLCIGDSINRVSTIESVSEKTGRSGSLVFVKVRHEIHRNDDRDVAITEFHDIVFREVTSGGPAPSQRAPERSTWSKDWIPDDVLLFRYSALTFNGHRIHYDRRYVTEVEGYPGLVVHGPLIATMLLDLLRTHHPESRVTRFQFKAVSPLFDIHPFSVCGDPLADGNSFHLWARDHQGALAMDATAVIERAATQIWCG